jgi:hypothetical protein
MKRMLKHPKKEVLSARKKQKMFKNLKKEVLAKRKKSNL